MVTPDKHETSRRAISLILGGSFRSAFITALAQQYLCSSCTSSNRMSCCVLWPCHGQALRLVSFYAADWSSRPPAEPTLVPAMSAQRTLRERESECTLPRLPVGEGTVESPTSRPSESWRPLPSESFHPSPFIRVLPSESFHPSPSIRVLSSESFHPSPFIRVLSSESFHLRRPCADQNTAAVAASWRRCTATCTCSNLSTPVVAH
jgi:hypothetical protein